MTPHSVTSQIPSADVELLATTSPWSGLLALWRHAVWVGMLFVLLVVFLTVQLSVKQTVLDLERNVQLTREATLQHERLRLEVQTRRRAVAMEGLATALHLTGDVPMVTP